MFAVTKENLHRQVLSSEETILLDFWAPWHMPSRIPAPALTVLDARPDVRVGRVNLEDEPEVANRFAVRCVPTLILIRDGKEAGRLTGRYVGREVEELL